jgi:creatinine amidohydrolase
MPTSPFPIAEEPHSYLLSDLAWPDVAAQLERDDTVLIPFGSTEQHGYHLPLGTDTYNCTQIVERAAVKAKVLYTPPLWTGYAPHHMRKPNEGTGTITVRASTLCAVLYDIARSLIYHGASRLIFVNGHASNNKVTDPLLRRLRYETNALIVNYSPWGERYLGIVADIMEGPPEETPGWHAGELETSEVMVGYPQTVVSSRMRPETAHSPSWLPKSFEKMDTNPGLSFKGYEYFTAPMEHWQMSDSGLVGNPLRATREKGDQSIQRFADYLVDAIAELRTVPVEVTQRDWPERASW